MSGQDDNSGHTVTMAARKKSTPAQMIGWREWLALPDLKIPHVKAKIDTGARSSCLHAIDVVESRRGDQSYVRFKVHPLQRNTKQVIEVKAKVLEYRRIRSSNGISSLRPVIVTNISWQGMSWPIELTLTGRADMGFRMLLGREAIRSRFLVDTSASFYGGKPLAVPKKKSKTPSKKKS